MKRPVVWTTQALEELLSISRYISADNPNAAQIVSARLRRAAAQLSELPTGRPGRVARTYEKPAPGPPYILAYEIAGAPDGRELIAILHVIHGARDWPEGEWPKT